MLLALLALRGVAGYTYAPGAARDGAEWPALPLATVTNAAELRAAGERGAATIVIAAHFALSESFRIPDTTRAIVGRCIDPPPEALGAPVPTRCLLPQQCLIATTGGHAIHHDAALQHSSDSSARSAPLLLHNLYLYGGHRGQPGAGAFRWRPEAAQRNASALWASSVTVQGLERLEVESRALFADCAFVDGRDGLSTNAGVITAQRCVFARNDVALHVGAMASGGAALVRGSTFAASRVSDLRLDGDALLVTDTSLDVQQPAGAPKVRRIAASAPSPEMFVTDTHQAFVQAQQASAAAANLTLDAGGRGPCVWPGTAQRTSVVPIVCGVLGAALFLLLSLLALRRCHVLRRASAEAARDSSPTSSAPSAKLIVPRPEFVVHNCAAGPLDARDACRSTFITSSSASRGTSLLDASRTSAMRFSGPLRLPLHLPPLDDPAASSRALSHTSSTHTHSTMASATRSAGRSSCELPSAMRAASAPLRGDRLSPRPVPLAAPASASLPLGPRVHFTPRGTRDGRRRRASDGSEMSDASAAGVVLRRQLAATLTAVAARVPPVVLAGAYVLLQERIVGGEAVVNFARGLGGTQMQFAVKFFHVAHAYHAELERYQSPVLRPLMPLLLHASARADCAVAGVALPPFVICERGATLLDWARHKRSSGELAAAIRALARLLASLHAAGRVHRDLKPENALHLPRSDDWRLLGLDLSAPAGEHLWPQCTPAYAAPETVSAVYDRRHLATAAAHDVWALGVMAFEATVGCHSAPTMQVLKLCAAGTHPYPWELPRAEQPAAWRASPLRRVLAPCLSRDPAARPSAALLAAGLSGLAQERVARRARGGHRRARSATVRFALDDTARLGGRPCSCD